MKHREHSMNERFELVKERIKIYANAHCVVTNKLHVALPCLTQNTPVLMTLPRSGNCIPDMNIRIGDNLELLNHNHYEDFAENNVDYDFINPPANPDKYLPYREKIIKSCSDFIKDCEAGKISNKYPYTEAERQEYLIEILQQKVLQLKTVVDIKNAALSRNNSPVPVASYNGKEILNAPIVDMREKYLSVENKRITFSQILLIPTTMCTLRCRYCAAGNQYAKRKNFEPKQTIEDFDKLMSVCKTKQVNIQGGEVFLNKQLPLFFELFSQMKNINNCETVAVFTNATVIPTDEQLEAYSKINVPKKFMISNYDLPNVRVDKFVSKIKQFNLDYVIFPKDKYWNHPGSPEQEIGYTNAELKEIIRRCTKFGREPKLIDGRFSACGQNSYALYDKLSDYVDIRNCPQAELEAQIYSHMFNMESYGICRYCRGEFDGCERVPPAEQMSKRQQEAFGK
jgi:organic radical activating enzyme